ncbi:hypothetical protein ACLK1S_06060 [Escherichia coli]
MGRPLMFYGQRIHEMLSPRPLHAGRVRPELDDDAARKGYCLYKMGCKGTTTYNACSFHTLNDGVSFPIQSGHGCSGLCGKWFLGLRFVLQPRGRYSANGYSFHRRYRRFNRAWRGGSGCWCDAVASAVDQRRRHNQQPTET